MYRYDATSLHRYICFSSNFDDPLTRTPYELHEIMRLDRLVKSDEKLHRSVDRRKEASQMHIHRESITSALEHELSDIFDQATLVRDGMDALFTFQNDLLPVFVECFENLKLTATPQRCANNLDEFLARLRHNSSGAGPGLHESLFELLHLLRASCVMSV